MAGQVAAADRPRAAARPQPQTTGEQQGGPFIRHAPKGRRPIYNFAASFGVYFGPAVVAAPGWYSGFRLRPVSATAAGTGGVIAATAGGQDAPFSVAGLVQVKDAWGTNLMSGPGYDMLFLVQLLSGAYGWGPTRDLRNLPSWTGITAASGAFAYDTLLPFEFAQAYGVIAAANAALLPQVQISTNTLATMFSTSPSTPPTLSYELDADFYWLPDAPSEPPGIGTTCQWIYQPCNPPVPSAASQRVQLPRLGGYLSILGLDLRDSTGARVDGYPGFSGGGRPGIFVDSVEQINSDLNFILDDLAIQMWWGAVISGASQTGAGTVTFPRPTGVLAVSRKTSLAQMDLGLLDTGEKYLSTNPGTQVEINGTPWSTISNTPATLNAVIGQIVPSGPMVQGLPEV
jgi:hypothetical protein